ncbi:MAG: DoxX family protein [Kofleriaceae bacterium]|nr:DoxX family protein [Kofleriaceae bacterium]
MKLLVPIGRALFSVIFIHAVITHFTSGAISAASAHGVPLATLVVPLAGILAAVGGVMILFGYRAKFGAFLLLLFLVPVTFVMHDFWNVNDATQAAMQRVQFLKNTSLVGATLLIMYYGAGPISLDD